MQVTVCCKVSFCEDTLCGIQGHIVEDANLWVLPKQFKEIEDALILIKKDEEYRQWPAILLSRYFKICPICRKLKKEKK